MTADGFGAVGKQIQQLSERAKEPHIEILRDGSKLIYFASGESLQVHSDRRPMNPELDDFDSLVQYSSQLDPALSAVFVGATHVRVMIDVNKIEDGGGELMLRATSELKEAVALQDSPRAFQPRELRRFTKFQLPSIPKALVDACSRIDFTVNQSAHKAAAKNQESLGRSVHMEAQSAQDIPDSVQINLEALAVRGLSCKVSMELLVNIDLANQVIELQLAPDEQVRCHSLVLATVAEAIRQKVSQPVYVGEPGTDS